MTLPMSAQSTSVPLARRCAGNGSMAVSGEPGDGHESVRSSTTHGPEAIAEKPSTFGLACCGAASPLEASAPCVAAPLDTSKLLTGLCIPRYTNSANGSTLSVPGLGFLFPRGRSASSDAFVKELVERMQSANTEDGGAYRELSSALPRTMNPTEKLHTLREIWGSQVVRPRAQAVSRVWGAQPSTLETREAQWKGVPIDVLGFEHGVLWTGDATRKAISKYISRNPTAVVACEDRLAKPFGVDFGSGEAEVGDTSLISGFVRRSDVLLSLLTPLLCVPVGAAAAGYAALTAAGWIPHRLGPVSYDEDTQKLGYLPEAWEMEALRTAGRDDTLSNRLIFGRSEYMAGYLAAMAENVSRQWPEGKGPRIAFLCGGGHLPRVLSCLKAGHRDKLPLPAQHFFDQGYERGRAVDVRDYAVRQRREMRKRLAAELERWAKQLERIG